MAEGILYWHNIRQRILYHLQFRRLVFDVDYWLMLSYGYAGPGAQTVQHSANFRKSLDNPESTDWGTESGMYKLSSRYHVSKYAIVMGTPSYAHVYRNKTNAGEGMEEGDYLGKRPLNAVDQAKLKLKCDAHAVACTGYDASTGELFSLETESTMRQKSELVRDRDFAGIIAEDLDKDLAGNRSMLAISAEKSDEVLSAKRLPCFDNNAFGYRFNRNNFHKVVDEVVGLVSNRLALVSDNILSGHIVGFFAGKANRNCIGCERYANILIIKDNSFAAECLDLELIYAHDLFVAIIAAGKDYWPVHKSLRAYEYNQIAIHNVIHSFIDSLIASVYWQLVASQADQHVAHDAFALTSSIQFPLIILSSQITVLFFICSVDGHFLAPIDWHFMAHCVNQRIASFVGAFNSPAAVCLTFAILARVLFHGHELALALDADYSCTISVDNASEITAGLGLASEFDGNETSSR
ncbi:hypothetical protein HIM_02506 [Hirsutella minnesotensis 3608]|nr:hypothetical protein HIM_02506 [Hirsutella minnesotensis 3608]